MVCDSLKFLWREIKGTISMASQSSHHDMSPGDASAQSTNQQAEEVWLDWQMCRQGCGRIGDRCARGDSSSAEHLWAS